MAIYRRFRSPGGDFVHSILYSRMWWVFCHRRESWLIVACWQLDLLVSFYKERQPTQSWQRTTWKRLGVSNIARSRKIGSDCGRLGKGIGWRFYCSLMFFKVCSRIAALKRKKFLLHVFQSVQEFSVTNSMTLFVNRHAIHEHFVNRERWLFASE